MSRVQSTAWNWWLVQIGYMYLARWFTDLKPHNPRQIKGHINWDRNPAALPECVLIYLFSEDLVSIHIVIEQQL